MFITLNCHISATSHTISKINFRDFAKSFVKKVFNIKLVFNSIKIKNYFAYIDPILNDLKSFLVYKFTSTSCSSSYIGVILKLALRSISKRITSLIFLNIDTLLKRALTHIILFVLK